MIYLVESSAMKKSEDGKVVKYFRLLKIGYVGDNGLKKRFIQYLLHNPTSELVKTIKGGTEEHESRLHYKFKDLLFPDYGREWFYYDKSIVEFFKSDPTLEDLEKLPRNPVRGDKDFLEKERECKRVCSYFFSDKKEVEEFLKEVRQVFGDKLEKDVFLKYSEEKLGKEVVESYYKVIKEIDSGGPLSKDLQCLIKETTIKGRLKILCEVSKENFQKLLDLLPKSDKVKLYLETLGRDKVKATGYSQGKMNKAMNIITFNLLALKTVIHKEFKEGDRLSKSELKSRLKDIYSSLNYKASPKAVDIEKFFEVKVINIKDQKSGKLVKGFELIKKKKL